MTKPRGRKGHGTPTPDAIRIAVAALAVELGVKPAADALGISPTTISRLAAGMDVREGTLSLVRAKLKKLAEEPPAPAYEKPQAKRQPGTAGARPQGRLTATIGERLTPKGWAR